MSTANTAPVTLGKYQVRGALGRGAMGTVYDGWDPVIGRRVAIKTVPLLDTDDPDMQEALARFKNEAQAAGRLTHHNVVGVYDYGESDETAFIVMEFVDGQSLKELLDAKERFAVAETVRVMKQVLAGLQFSHDKGVIHRDIKPGNVMMTRDGQVKLADFGIARIESSVMTQAGTMLGTPAYMSPEQLMAQTVDARSDIYSSGVLLYQLLTGERPFEGGLTAIIHKALNTSPPRPSEISVTAPASLDAVVARAMAKRPDDRYPTAAAFARALEEAAEAPQPAPADLDAAADAEATMIVPSQRAVPGPASPAPPASVPSAAAPSAIAPSAIAPSATAQAPAIGANKRNPAVLVGAAVVVLGLAGGGAWFALRPAAPDRVPSVTASTGVTPPAAAPAPAPLSPTAATQPAPPSTPPAQPPLGLASSPDARPDAGPAAATGPQATHALPPPQPLPPAPQPAAAAPIDLAALRNTLAALATSSRCAIPRFAVTGQGAVNASGLVGVGAPDAALRQAVGAAVPSASLTWAMRDFDGPYCDVLDIVRPIALAGAPALGLALKDDVTHLRAHDFVLTVVNMPAFPAYLLVDYFSHDGSVAHLFPFRGAPNQPFADNATVRLGTTAKDRVEVGPPFGTDMIVATASSVPLFPGAARNDETVQTYLPALKAAIEAAQQRGARLAGQALILDTAAR